MRSTDATSRPLGIVTACSPARKLVPKYGARRREQRDAPRRDEAGERYEPSGDANEHRGREGGAAESSVSVHTQA
ncbi:MAG: hypothetical protein JWN27_3411 [Candidatus Eremiobacteraeota bacterium]|nr:hypothetical protein [Candidatus Eremiobacteraeota bacterium]